MPAREPKRTYSPLAIERWFERLSMPWESHFEREVLERARDLYKESLVRELHLEADTLVVHRKNGRDEIYSVVEWENGAPNVRSGTRDSHEGRALAVAGLYEAEELVCTEVSAVPPEVAEVPPAQKCDERPIMVRHHVVAEAQKPHLKLRLKSTPRGIRLSGHWVEGLVEKPAFASLREEAGELDHQKREVLISITGRARKAGFVFRASKGDFVMSNALSIPSFVRRDLPRWRESYDVEADPRLHVLGEGVRKVTIRARAHDAGGRGVGIDWSADIDGEVLDKAHAKALMRRPGQVLIFPDMGLLRMDTNQSADLVDWKGHAPADGEAQVPYYMLFSLFQSETLPVELSEDLARWRERLMSPPSGMDAEAAGCSFLRDYQRRGVAWMRHLLENGCHGLLADEMGLGKTVQVLTLIRSCASASMPSLIVCPASVVPVWRSEAEKFFPRMRIETLRSGHTWEEVREPCLWVASYTQLRRNKVVAAQTPFDFVVLDEAQFIKNPDAKITQVSLSLKAERRIAVTGTPVENRELDLWTIFRFLMPGLLGSRAKLERMVLDDSALLRAKLSKQVAPFILRRSKTEVASELPPKVESILSCPLTHLQQNEYSRLAREGLASLGDDLNKSVVERTLPFFTLLTRLRQTCCDPGLLPWMDAGPRQSGKILALVEKLRELVAHGRRAVVFSQFTSLLLRLKGVIREEFPDLPVEMLTGDTANREKPVNAFQKTQGAAVILVSLRAGGTGITLSAAEYVFLMDPWWNPAVEAQAIDRVHRIGQDRTVFIYRLISSGTIEERIEKLKEKKRELFDGTVGRLADMSRFSNYFQSLGDLIGIQPEGLEGEE